MNERLIPTLHYIQTVKAEAVKHVVIQWWAEEGKKIKMTAHQYEAITMIINRFWREDVRSHARLTALATDKCIFVNEEPK